MDQVGPDKQITGKQENFTVPVENSVETYEQETL